MLCVLFHAIQPILFLYIMPNTKQTTGKPHSVMAIQTNSLFALLVLLGSASVSNFVAAAKITNNYYTTFFNRTSFPPGFIFGTASSAYQVKHSTLLISISHSADVFQLEKKKKGKKDPSQDYLFVFVFLFFPQYEGAATEGGRGPSLWDTYTHRHPGFYFFYIFFSFFNFLLTGIVKC